MAKRKNSKKKKTTGMAVALWFLAFLVILVVFLAKKDTIVSNLKQTKFFERIGVETPEFVKNHPDTETPSRRTPKQDDLIKIDVEPETTNKIPEPPVEKEPPTTVTETPKTSEPITDKNAENKNTDSKTETPKESKPETPKTPEKPKTINASLYFVQIDGDGKVNLKQCPRTIAKTDSPLTEVIKTLLSGPTYEEKTKNAITAIPAGTRLISASVKDGVAYLNFSEEFQFNTLGVEGYLAQLRQIVYTATTFSTVTSVQFLIEGQKTDYLGSEGVWIGSPIGR